MTWDLPVTCKTMPWSHLCCLMNTKVRLTCLWTCSNPLQALVFKLKSRLPFSQNSNKLQKISTQAPLTSWTRSFSRILTSNHFDIWLIGKPFIDLGIISWTSLGFGQNKQSSSCQSHLTDQSETRVAFCEQKVQFEHLLLQQLKDKHQKDWSHTGSDCNPFMFCLWPPREEAQACVRIRSKVGLRSASPGRLKCQTEHYSPRRADPRPGLQAANINPFTPLLSASSHRSH